MSDAQHAEPKPHAPVRNNGWIWYFGFLFVASVGVALFMIWFNLSIQLKPEQLEIAHKRWRENGPKNYKMLLKKKLNNEDKVTTFMVNVRNKKVTEVMMDGKPLPQENDNERDMNVYHSMDATFSFVQTFMTKDHKENAPKVYVTALFDPENGALLRYVRRVMGTTQRVELNITLEAIE